MDTKVPTEFKNDAERNEAANVLTKRGIALLNIGSEAALKEAIGYFETAIGLRKNLISEPWYCYGLIAGWMNRGDALTKLGGDKNLAEALRSYDEALRLLGHLPMDQEPLFRRRLAVAWMNRGITLQAQQRPESLNEAVNSFKQSIEVSKYLLPLGNPVVKLDLACGFMNHANALLEFAADEASAIACKELREALELVRDMERKDLFAAEIGFKVRHILCRALGRLITDHASENAGFIQEATDAVEEGMALVRHWQGQGVNQFDGLMSELFHFGALVYCQKQPHFLAEFLLENLEPQNNPVGFSRNAKAHADAAEVLWRSLKAMQQVSFVSLEAGKVDSLIEVLKSLQFAETRLAELRSRLTDCPD